MALSQRLAQARHLYHEYPPQFRVLIGASFIDQLGGALLFPFFTLYITAKFGVGMTTVGVIFGLFSISGLVGSTISGALADRWGRKNMMLFGLLTSAFSSLLMGLVNDVQVFFALAVFVGLFSNAGGPAQQAMVADLLPPRQRAEGYGIARVVANLAVTIGPAIGGLIAARSYLGLFIVDAVTSTITAFIVLLVIRETKPATTAESSKESWWQTFRGYGVALRDSTYMIFLLASVLATIVYMQMNTTLSVYLRDVHGIPAQGFGYLLSMNAAMVVLFQFAITRRIRGYAPMRVMVVGTLLYAVGFGLFGPATGYPLFVLAMIIITVGEMLVVPVSQAVVAHISPEDKRGRYMAVYGYSWALPTAIGPLLAGIVMDNADPRLVWYAGFGLALVAALIFQGLGRRLGGMQEESHVPHI